MWILYIFLCASAAANAENHGLDKGLIFIEKATSLVSASSWLITLDVNISDFRQGLLTFTESVNAFNPAHQFNKLTENYDLDENLILYLEKEARYFKIGAESLLKEIDGIEFTINGLTEANRREKRSVFDLGGDVLQFLFGSATDKDYNKLNRKIENLTSSNSEMTHIVKEQLTIINKSYATLVDQQRKFQKLQLLTDFLQKDFITFQKQQKDEINKINYRLEFLSKVLQVARSLSDTFDALSLNVHQLKTAFQFARMGQLDEYFLPHQKFLRLLKEVQVKLPHGKEILAHNVEGNLQIMYHLAELSVFAYKGLLRIFIHFPIYDSAKLFKIYKVLPLPTKINNSDLFFMIQPRSEYFAISKNLEYYYPMTLSDFLACVQNTLFVCAPTQTIYKSSEQHCLYNLFTGKLINIEQLCNLQTLKTFQPIFYQHEDSYDYIHSVDRFTPITFSCDNKKDAQNAPRSLIGTGFLHVPNACTVIGHTFVVFGNNLIRIGATMIKSQVEVPKIEHFPSIKLIEQKNIDFSQGKYNMINALFLDKNNLSEIPVDIATVLKEIEVLENGKFAETIYNNVDAGHILLTCLVAIILLALSYYLCVKKWLPNLYAIPRIVIRFRKPTERTTEEADATLATDENAGVVINSPQVAARLKK